MGTVLLILAAVVSVLFLFRAATRHAAYFSLAGTLLAAFAHFGLTTTAYVHNAAQMLWALAALCLVNHQLLTRRRRSAA